MSIRSLVLRLQVLNAALITCICANLANWMDRWSQGYFIVHSRWCQNIQSMICKSDKLPPTSVLSFFMDMGSVDFGSRLQCWFREGISVPPGTGLIDVASVFGIELQFCRLLS